MNTVSISIPFAFPDEEENDLQKLNLILASIKADAIRFRQVKSYITTVTDRKGIRRCFGLVSGEIACTLNPNGEIFQVDLRAVKRSVPQEEYMELWRERYPDRLLHSVSVYTGFRGDYLGYLIVYRPKSPAPQQLLLP